MELMHNQNKNNFNFDVVQNIHCYVKNRWKWGVLPFDLCNLSTVYLCLETKGYFHEINRLGMAICYLCVRMRRKEGDFDVCY